MKDLFNNLLTTAFNLKQHIKPEFSDTGAAGAVIKVAQMMCYGAAVIILIILGVKFISAAPDGKAQIKERMVPAIAGAIFLFAIGSIIRIVGGFAINTI